MPTGLLTKMEISILTFLNTFGKNILISLFIFAIGIFAINKINKILTVFLHKSKIEPSIVSFLNSLIKFFLNFLVIFSILSLFSLNILTIIASFGASLVALSIVLKDSIGNFMAGMSVVLNKPIRVGDYVEIGNAKGVVIQIEMFFTILRDKDKTVVVPNKKLVSEIIHRNGNWDISKIIFSLSVKKKVDDDKEEHSLKIREEDIQSIKNAIERHIVLYSNDILINPPSESKFKFKNDDELNVDLIVWSHKNNTLKVKSAMCDFLRNKLKKFQIEISIDDE